MHNYIAKRAMLSQGLEAEELFGAHYVWVRSKCLVESGVRS